MDKITFYRKIESGVLQGACRYFEYWFCYENTPPKSNVLELGGGRSVLAQTLMEDGCRVWVTEINRSDYLYHKNLEAQNSFYHAVKVSGEKLPLPSGFFDVVISASSIEHFNPDNNGDIETIAEVYRVLKPGGRFILTVPIAREYKHNRYAGNPNHPPEKVYNEAEYRRRFLPLFSEGVKKFFKPANEMPTLFKPNPTWKIINTKPGNGFNDATGLCVVLLKQEAL